MALFRAVETARPESRRLFEDRYAADFLTGRLRTVAALARLPVIGRTVAWALDVGWPRTRSSGVVRTRFIDDVVRAGLGAGAGQLVLLGAGFDSRPYRLAEAEGVAVFEVDHPATQVAKRARLARASGPLPPQVRFVAVDFERDDFETELTRAGYRTAVPAVVVWEGVVSYLSAAAVDLTFARLQRLSAPGSRLVFTYVHQGAIDGSLHFEEAKRWKGWVRFNGEPFTYGFEPRQLADYLSRYGFALRSDASTEEIAVESNAASGRHELGSTFYRVAVAERR